MMASVDKYCFIKKAPGNIPIQRFPGALFFMGILNSNSCILLFKENQQQVARADYY